MPNDHSLQQSRAQRGAACRAGWATALLLAIGLCSAASYAQTSDAPTELSVQVPPGCGSKGAFVEQLLTLEPSSTLLENRRLSVTIERLAPEATYVLRLTDGDTTREIKDGDCVTLFRTAVVIAAAAPTAAAPVAEVVSPPQAASGNDVAAPAQQVKDVVEPPSAAGATPPAQAVNARPSQVVSIVQVEDEDVADTSKRPVDVGVELHLGAGGALGATPKLSFAAEAAAGLVLDRWVLSLVGRYLPQSTTLAGVSTRLRTEVWGARLGAGYDITSKLRGALGIAGYRIQAEAVGIRHPASDSVWLLAPELEAAVQVIEWQDWRGEIAIQGRVAVNTPRFEMEPNEAVIFAVPRLGASGFFRIKWAR